MNKSDPDVALAVLCDYGVPNLFPTPKLLRCYFAVHIAVGSGRDVLGYDKIVSYVYIVCLMMYLFVYLCLCVFVHVYNKSVFF